MNLLREAKAPVPLQLEDMAWHWKGDEVRLLSSYFLFVVNFFLGAALVVIAAIWEKLLMKNLVFLRSLDSLYICLHRIYMNLSNQNHAWTWRCDKHWNYTVTVLEIQRYLFIPNTCWHQNNTLDPIACEYTYVVQTFLPVQNCSNSIFNTASQFVFPQYLWSTYANIIQFLNWHSRRMSPKRKCVKLEIYGKFIPNT